MIKNLREQKKKRKCDKNMIFWKYACLIVFQN